MSENKYAELKKRYERLFKDKKRAVLGVMLYRIDELNKKPITDETKKQAAQLDYELIGYIDELNSSRSKKRKIWAKNIECMWHNSKFYGYCLEGYE